MKVLMVASESHPFIKTGGLGDVVGALPQELKKIGIDIRVIIPNYHGIKEEYKRDFKFIKWFMVPVGWREQYCGIFQYEHRDVIYYFLDNEYYYKRDNLYGYDDDGERFAFFNRSVLNSLKELDWKPDVIHCNDWQAGMIPVLHKVEYKKDDFYKDIKSIVSIHNLFFTGNFPADILPELFGYDYELFTNGGLELHDGVSFLRGAICYSDMVTTVSKTYADEIRTPQYGEHLDWLLNYKGNFLRGIVNGIDYEEYNPERDKYIAQKYSSENIEAKYINKCALQKELELPINEGIPIIAMVSRLTNQKGCNLIMDIMEELLKEDVQIVVLGTGDYLYEEGFEYFKKRYPQKVSANIMFDNALAHKIYAGADMFLMPSLFEPCGLGQLIALRYGTLPIVRETGGLKDTVIPYNQYTGVGNGFGFKNYNSYELKNTIKYALDIYKDGSNWYQLVNQAMTSNNSWEKSANEYKNMYKEVVGE